MFVIIWLLLKRNQRTIAWIFTKQDNSQVTEDLENPEESK